MSNKVDLRKELRLEILSAKKYLGFNGVELADFAFLGNIKYNMYYMV